MFDPLLVYGSHLPNELHRGGKQTLVPFSQIKRGRCERHTSSEGGFRVYRFTCVGDGPKVVETVLQIFSAIGVTLQRKQPNLWVRIE